MVPYLPLPPILLYHLRAPAVPYLPLTPILLYYVRPSYITMAQHLDSRLVLRPIRPRRVLYAPRIMNQRSLFKRERMLRYDRGLGLGREGSPHCWCRG